MLELTWLIPALPLAGFMVLVLFGRRLGEPTAGILAASATFASFAVAVGVFLALAGEPAAERRFGQVLFEWIPAGEFSVDVGFLVDPLSITWVLFVTGVSALIHLYAIGYMHGDPRFHVFFAYLNLFVFSMLMLVLGDNFLLTFLGWEGVGACSYFLISFWFTDEANATAGKKAFVTNRIGDWGFLVAMFLTFSTFGTLSYSGILAPGPDGVVPAAGLAAGTATAISLLFFVGAVGKSAQLPLFVWLPDAMAGPTPVSALIHAATMVTAGVYLMVRINPILAAADAEVGTLIAWVGAITALVAATIAVAQNDIKKVLAYSTISQLGYMFLAVGVGAYVAAVFHVITHAFFKALLFLGAGSVIHGVHDEQDMRRMGGLARWMPVTHATFVVGWLAIAGIPPLAGFWSKDEILVFGYAESAALFAVGAVTALLTATYMTRQYVMVFRGAPRWDAEVETAVDDRGAEPEGAPAAPAAEVDDPHAAEPHESGGLMTLPLVVLAVLAVAAGGLNLPFAPDLKFLEEWLVPVVPFEAHLDLATSAKVGLAIGSAAIAALGIAAGFAAWSGDRERGTRLEHPVLSGGWGIDSFFAWMVDVPGRAVFAAAAWFDSRVIDGAVNGVGVVVRSAGSGLRGVQSGLVRTYALVVTIGVVALLAYVVTRMTF